MFFFEPDNSRDVHKRVTESLISDSFVYTSNMENTRILLGKETEKQGLRGADLAELTGWSPSKTSKLTAGKQTLIFVNRVMFWKHILMPLMTHRSIRQLLITSCHCRYYLCLVLSFRIMPLERMLPILALILILRKDLETQQRVSDFGSVLLQAERI